MPPVLDPENSKVDGLAFLGLSLSRKDDKVGHPDSVTHQTAFDMNKVQDRDYNYLRATNDDGWLCGGGEPGPPKSYKLAAKDSAHCEIMRIGTYEPKWGGVSQEDIVSMMQFGTILIPQVEVLPTSVIANGDKPPELEVRFDMEEYEAFFADPMNAPLPINWQLRFLHNQLFKYFKFPSRFCPGPHHSTILRKAEFRSPEHKKQYFNKCQEAIDEWRKAGPKPLHPIDQVANVVRNESDDYKSGIYLFTDRNTITHYFEPNFLPPYDSKEKRRTILAHLTDEWDEHTLSWKPWNDKTKSWKLPAHLSENKEDKKEAPVKSLEAVAAEPEAPVRGDDNPLRPVTKQINNAV